MTAVMQLISKVGPTIRDSATQQFLKIRRRRRVRFGLKTGNWLGSQSDELLERYGRLEEEDAVRMMSELRLGVNLETFSDEEDHEQSDSDLEGEGTESESDGEEPGLDEIFIG